MDMKKKAVLAFVCLLTGCNTTPLINLANDAKCKTEIGGPDPKFSCEFEGRKLTGRK
jgi:hypothetical protein